jgi:hypothetical protein
MKHGEETNLSSEMFGVEGNLQKSFRTGAEQEVIEDLLVLQRQLGKLVRQGEDNMDIGDCQEFILASRDPFIAGSALALGAMPIAATVKGDGAIATSRALVAVPAQCRRATACDGPEDFAVGPVDPTAVVLDEAIALCANDIGHLEGWPGHFFFSLRERWMWSRLESARVSSGLVTACRCLGDRCR